MYELSFVDKGHFSCWIRVQATGDKVSPQLSSHFGQKYLKRLLEENIPIEDARAFVQHLIKIDDILAQLKTTFLMQTRDIDVSIKNVGLEEGRGFIAQARKRLDKYEEELNNLEMCLENINFDIPNGIDGIKSLRQTFGINLSAAKSIVDLFHNNCEVRSHDIPLR